MTVMITKLPEGQAAGGTVVRRNLPGTRTQGFCQWPEEPFEEMDSTLAVQQYIQQTIRREPQVTSPSLLTLNRGPHPSPLNLILTADRGPHPSPLTPHPRTWTRS